MSALILIELNGSEVSSNSRAAITAATQLSEKIDALVLTDDSANATSVASLDSINTVKVIADSKLEHVSVGVASKLVAEALWLVINTYFLDLPLIVKIFYQG